MLLAVAIFAGCAAAVYATFSTTLRAWRRGGDALGGLRRGEVAIEGLARALRSAVYVKRDAQPWIFGFRLEAADGDPPEDRIGWVTASSAFMPPDAARAHGLRRIEFFIDRDAEGEAALYVRARPYLEVLREDDAREPPEPWLAARHVQGLECRVWNAEEKSWEDVWENTNALPERVSVTVYVAPRDAGGEPTALTRVVEIPLARLSIQRGRRETRTR